MKGGNVRDEVVYLSKVRISIKANGKRHKGEWQKHQKKKIQMIGRKGENVETMWSLFQKLEHR